MTVKEQSIFYKTPQTIKSEAKDSLRGAWGKSIKANLLGLLVPLVFVALFFVCLFLINIDWLQIFLCSLCAVLFVFFFGTFIVGNTMFYVHQNEEDTKIKTAFASYNNIWKYGRMFLYKLLLCLLVALISFGLITLVFVTMYRSLWNLYLEGEIATLGALIDRAKNYGNFNVIVTMCVILGVISLIWFIWQAINNSMVFMTVAIEPKQTLTKAYKQNRISLKGNKMRFVRFWLSMLPHILLCVLTAGIYFIWFWPYYQEAKVVFYKDLLAEF